MLEAFAHFSLACYASIGENPALSNSDVNWPVRMAGPLKGHQGQGQHIPARAEPRSLQKEADAPGFHSFFTSVEIAQD
jgi:hypothetical protein